MVDTDIIRPMFLPQYAQTAGYKYHRINKFADHTSLWRGPCIDVDRHIDIRATIAESSGVQVGGSFDEWTHALQ